MRTMIEDSFTRLYAHDFSQMAGRAEMGQDVDDALARRIRDASAHARIMDDRKGPGHLAALAARVRDDALLFNTRVLRMGGDPEEAAERRRILLNAVADRLVAPPVLAQAA